MSRDFVPLASYLRAELFPCGVRQHARREERNSHLLSCDHAGCREKSAELLETAAQARRAGWPVSLSNLGTMLRSARR